MNKRKIRRTALECTQEVRQLSATVCVSPQTNKFMEILYYPDSAIKNEIKKLLYWGKIRALWPLKKKTQSGANGVYRHILSFPRSCQHYQDSFSGYLIPSWQCFPSSVGNTRWQSCLEIHLVSVSVIDAQYPLHFILYWKVLGFSRMLSFAILCV